MVGATVEWYVVAKVGLIVSATGGLVGTRVALIGARVDDNVCGVLVSFVRTIAIQFK